MTVFAKSIPASEDGQGDFSFDYEALHQWSLKHVEQLWSHVWDFGKVIGEKGSRVLVDGDKMPGAQFFPDAKINFAENLLRDRPDSEPTIVFWGEDTVKQKLNFGQLKQQVASLAAFFRAEGIKSGDRIAAYIHNGPEAIIGMLAASSMGAVWSSASPDFGVQGVLDRFGQIEPSFLIVSDGYFYKGQVLDRLANARELQSKLPTAKKMIIVPYARQNPSLDGLTNALLWPDVLAKNPNAKLQFDRQPFNHPLYIMFSSGTTGVPKCIVHGQGGTLLQHLKEHLLQCDIRAGDRVFYATTTGWMMWNWQVTALACKATLLLYDGFVMQRDNKILWDYAQEEKATLFGTSAGYIKAIEKAGLKPRETHDLSALRIITSTGSPLLPDSFDYVYKDIKPEVLLASISGGTDIVSLFVCGNPWGPIHRGEIQCAGLGMAVEVRNSKGERVVGEQGELVCTKPFPCMPVYFWNDKDGAKYNKAYFAQYPGIWCHGDFATETVHHGFEIHGRSDATLNPQGVRIGTADIYNIVERMPEIAEALAVDQEWDGTTRIVLFVKTQEGHHLDKDLESRIKKKLLQDESPRHVPAVIIEAPELPKTRSGKLVELAVREVIHGRPVKNIEALANPDALKFFVNLPQLKKAG
jgi:acetoacetyl-CoA synthetase